MRFANWLNNGQPTGTEGPGTTETGAYTLNGAVSDPALKSVTRNPGAAVFIPNENEWYKAAYYDPPAGHYWKYPTGTDTPVVSGPPGNTPNTANFYGTSTGYAVTGSTNYSLSQNYLTEVVLTRPRRAHRSFDQSGDVIQWTESLSPNGRVCAGVRGI